MKLYIYDHCPYCVKARMIFGLKAVPVELVTLLNDDEATPIRMIGQKMVPILEKDDGSYMPESMDIVRYIDRNYGEPLLQPVQGGEALGAWLSELRELLYPLAMPRWVQAPLEEFATEGSRGYFTRKKEAMIGPFADCLARSGELIAAANKRLEQLEEILPAARGQEAESALSRASCDLQEANHGATEITENDIHLFAALRSLSIVKGMAYPAKVEAYRQRMAKASNVPLHDAMAV